jgi:hypothetical protein
MPSWTRFNNRLRQGGEAWVTLSGIALLTWMAWSCPEQRNSRLGLGAELWCSIGGFYAISQLLIARGSGQAHYAGTKLFWLAPIELALATAIIDSTHATAPQGLFACCWIAACAGRIAIEQPWAAAGIILAAIWIPLTIAWYGVDNMAAAAAPLIAGAGWAAAGWPMQRASRQHLIIASMDSSEASERRLSGLHTESVQSSCSQPLSSRHAALPAANPLVHVELASLVIEASAALGRDALGASALDSAQPPSSTPSRPKAALSSHEGSGNPLAPTPTSTAVSETDAGQLDHVPMASRPSKLLGCRRSTQLAVWLTELDQLAAGVSTPHLEREAIDLVALLTTIHQRLGQQHPKSCELIVHTTPPHAHLLVDGIRSIIVLCCYVLLSSAFQHSSGTRRFKAQIRNDGDVVALVMISDVAVRETTMRACSRCSSTSCMTYSFSGAEDDAPLCPECCERYLEHFADSWWSSHETLRQLLTRGLRATVAANVWNATTREIGVVVKLPRTIATR